MSLLFITYVSYLALTIAMTMWVAKTLSSNGQIFLVDVFAGNKELANSVNHLLVVGFYLINLGYICVALKLDYGIGTVETAIEALSAKVGLVLLVLGVMHFTNLYVFSRIRIQASNRPPVLPDAFTEIGG